MKNTQFTMLFLTIACALCACTANGDDAKKVIPLGEGGRYHIYPKSDPSSFIKYIVFKLTKVGEKKSTPKIISGVYHIEWELEATYLYHQAEYDVVSIRGSSEPMKWVLHKSSDGWAIISHSDGAMALTAMDNAGESPLALRRNRGGANNQDQVWVIEPAKAE